MSPLFLPVSHIPIIQNLQFPDFEMCLTAALKPTFRTQPVGVFLTHFFYTGPTTHSGFVFCSPVAVL